MRNSLIIVSMILSGILVPSINAIATTGTADCSSTKSDQQNKTVSGTSCNVSDIKYQLNSGLVSITPAKNEQSVSVGPFYIKQKGKLIATCSGSLTYKTTSGKSNIDLSPTVMADITVSQCEFPSLVEKVVNAPITSDGSN